MEVLLTAKEVADILKIRSRTVVEKINNGELKASKIGKVWRIKQEDLVELIERK